MKKIRSKCGRVFAAMFAASGVSALAQSASTLTEGAKWESSAAFGFTMTQGNSETILTTFNLTSTKKWDKNEATVSGNLAYGENDGRRNADSQRISMQYNRLVSDHAFFYGRMEGLRDSVADIDYRLTLSPGGGYYFWRDPKAGFVRAELGPGYILEDKGGLTEQHYTMRAAERFEYKLSPEVRFWQSFEYLPDVDKFSEFRFVAEIGTEVKLVNSITLRTFIQDSFDNKPAKKRQNNDLKLVTQIGYRF